MSGAYQFWNINLDISKFYIENGCFGWIKASAVEWWDLAVANDFFYVRDFKKVVTMISEGNDDIVW
jgi:hypothetical protein